MEMGEMICLIDAWCGVRHDIRFVPSVIVGGGYLYRVTVSNVGGFKHRTYSVSDNSYTEALQRIIDIMGGEKNGS